MVTPLFLAALLALPAWPLPSSMAVGDSERPHFAKQASLFAVGALGAFVAHESGHLLANAVMGNKPHITPLYGFGFVPFFAISPELRCNRKQCFKANGQIFSPGPRGKFAIVTAGFEVQHLVSEWILTHDPQLRQHHAPFRKGWLAFNIGLSLAYALTSVLHIEDSHGDAGGAALLAGWPRPLMAAWLVAPAAADAYRYMSGPDPWAPWVSRGLKLGFVALAWTF